MDPTANVLEQERIILARRAGMNAAEQDDNTPYDPQPEARLRELQYALDAWIRDGGFEPDWTHAPNALFYYRNV